MYKPGTHRFQKNVGTEQIRNVIQTDTEVYNALQDREHDFTTMYSTTMYSPSKPSVIPNILSSASTSAQISVVSRRTKDDGWPKTLPNTAGTIETRATKDPSCTFILSGCVCGGRKRKVVAVTIFYNQDAGPFLSTALQWDVASKTSTLSR